MKLSKQLPILMTTLLMCSCSTHRNIDGLQDRLEEFVNGKDANIGISVIINGRDTVSVNGHNKFPMLSVYKFPIALTLADEYRRNNLSFDNMVEILPEDLHPDTWSPMTEKILSSEQMTCDTIKISMRELMRYMLQQSDNNASDIVLREAGGVESVIQYLDRIGENDINVCNSENEMHVDNSLCYTNSSTPIAMARLIDKFDREFNDSLSCEIKHLMETCTTGKERLPKELLSQNAVVGHKTGTGFVLPDGRLMAVNDAGYIHLRGKQNYTAALFIENSGYDMEHTEALIAEISRLISESVPEK